LHQMRAIVTGGAGFIGSHLVDALVTQNASVAVIDNMSNGTLDNLELASKQTKLEFCNGDLKKRGEWNSYLRDAEVVFHFAAHPEVRVGETSPEIHFNENLVATFNLLEAMRKTENARTIVFASTSTVYGEPTQFPTPEDYGPLLPISTYGASKLASESLISSYAHTFGMRGLILRLGNVVGPRGKHGVIVDLINKLKADPKTLEILGDGTQNKSYVHVSDCVQATLFATKKFLSSKERIGVYNVSSRDQVGVKRIAEIVSEQMALGPVNFRFTGGVDGGRGWLGDVKAMQLSVEKLSKLGWNPTMNSEQAVQKATHELLTES
jgi:UDP-glucose 4-epimerase